MASFFALGTSLFPGLDPQRQYLTCWHPHGALTFCAAFFTSRMSAESTTALAPGPHNWFVGIATLLFRFPFIGEYLALVKARPVTQSVSEELLEKGRSMALQPGGLPEQIVTDHRKEQLVRPLRALKILKEAVRCVSIERIIGSSS